MKIALSSVIGFLAGIFFTGLLLALQPSDLKTEATPEREEPLVKSTPAVSMGPYSRYFVTGGFGVYTEYLGEAEASYDRTMKAFGKSGVALVEESCTQKVLKGQLRSRRR